MNNKNIFLISVLISIAILSCKKDKPIPDITTGLVAYFPLNGSAFDSINDISGTIHSVVSTKNRNNKIGMAMIFNRADTSFIDFGDNANYSFSNNQFTINCWVYPTDTLYSGAILSKRSPGGPFEYSLDNHFNHAVFNFDNWSDSGSGSIYGIDPLSSSVTVKLNQWHMITYVADGSSLKVYSDGDLQSGVDNFNAGKFFSDTNTSLMFGVGGGWGVNYYFSGSLDDIKFYNRVLTDEQLKYLFQK